jgi:SNF2 family DNA or RNA helicase
MIKSSSKFLFLEKLLERLRKTGTRVLVFSQLVMMLDLLETFMKVKGYPYERLDGGVKVFSTLGIG